MRRYASTVMQRVRAASDALRTSFFFLPAIAVVVGFLGARWLVGVEVGDWVGRSTVDSARAVLATTAAATITFASITFSVSLLIMQQGSSQFSPRVIHGLVRDPFNRRVIAVVVGTFTFCLVSLQRVRGPVAEGGEEVVPELAVAVGLLLGVVAVLAVVAAINHTSRKMDVSAILGDIVEQATDMRTSPDTDDEVQATTQSIRSIPQGEPVTVVRFDADGWVRQIDRRGLLGVVDAGGIVRLETDAGRYAVRSTPLCIIWPAVAEARVEEVTRSARHCVRLGPTRTMREDAGYGARQLVDVALRALSPGINDPTTAQDAIFHLGTVLVDRLSSSPVPTAYHDGNGRCLLAPHALTDEDLAELAFAELRRAGAGQPAVAVYVLQTIALVADAARANDAGERIAPFVAQARLLLDNVDAAGLIDDDRASIHNSYRALFGN
jgi:uncharacterized membrane protein